jgi:pimeloyl-ACP methyl ester carboxylesterase
LGPKGGDWGSFVTARLGYAYPERLSGIHLNLVPIRRDPEMLSKPTPAESRFLEEPQVWLKEETGYQWIQGTRPQTLAFALTDSPADLAAWIVEKFRTWSDCRDDLESVFSRGNQAGAPRDRPTLENAIHFKPQVVVQAASACFWITKRSPCALPRFASGSLVMEKSRFAW